MTSNDNRHPITWLHAGHDTPTHYPSMQAAADAMGCSRSTVSARIRRGNTGDHDLQARNCKLPLVFRDTEYPNYYAAALDNQDVTYDYIRQNCELIDKDKRRERNAPPPAEPVTVILPVLVRRYERGDLCDDRLSELLDYNGLTRKHFENALEKGTQ